MKRFISISLAALMLATNVLASNINVQLDGEAVEFSTQQPVIIDGRTLIPLRGVFEKLGYEIAWDGATKTAFFVKDDTVVKVIVNAKEFTINGEAKPLDVPAQIVNGSMLLPLRAIGEATGLEVNWDNATKTVSLKSDDTSTEESTEETTSAVKTLDYTSLSDKDKKEIEDMATANINYVLVDGLCSNYFYIDIVNGREATKAKSEGDVAGVKEGINIAKADANAFKSAISVLISKGYDKELLSAVNSIIDASIADYQFEYDYYVDNKYGNITKKQYDEIKSKNRDNMNSAIENYRNKSKDYAENLLSVAEKTKYDYEDYDKLSDDEQDAVDKFKNEVCVVAEKETAFISDFEKAQKNGKAFTTAADNIKAKLNSVETPEICATERQTLLLACDIMSEAGKYVEKAYAVDDINKEYVIFDTYMSVAEFCFDVLLDNYTCKYVDEGGYEEDNEDTESDDTPEFV